MIPVIDIFAGPGGLGEGFASYTDERKKRVFKVVLSIEKDSSAYETLKLRSFFRQFEQYEVPSAYYSFLEIGGKLQDLYSSYPKEEKKAQESAWLKELGVGSSKTVDDRIRQALKGSSKWILVGGPPCQAYSLIGRSRNKGINPNDPRVFLYREYYRILAVHNPPIFILENVKGLLSAEIEQKKIFNQILDDLANPVTAFHKLKGHLNTNLKCPGYKIYSLVKEPTDNSIDGSSSSPSQDYIVKAEEYGIPQSRHRLILLGVRNDINKIPSTLTKTKNKIKLSDVLDGLPHLRSGISKNNDSLDNWAGFISKFQTNYILDKIDDDIRKDIFKVAQSIQCIPLDRGKEHIPNKPQIKYRPDWFLDPHMNCICNHSTRSHMKTDLLRYLFATCFARTRGISPKLSDFPKQLLPNHVNAKGEFPDSKFADRFRVQLFHEPSRTITSHISKDGHYYIHPDPFQCRSLTVREAARLQTFPDNYFFCGPRTSQYIQVGNAVPPLLANQIARIVAGII